MSEYKRYKKSLEHTYSFGVYPTLELLKYRIKEVEQILLSEKSGRNEGAMRIQEICEKEGIKIVYSDKLISNLSDKGNILAIGVLGKYPSEVSPDSDHLLLVEPSDRGNLGTICRSMVGFGVTELVVIGEGVDFFDPKVIRSSMGAVFQLNFSSYDNFENYSQRFQREYYPFMTNGEKELSEIKFNKPATLIFGNEGSGLDESFLEVGESVKISQGKEIDSLNLSVSVGISLYELYKQRV